MTSRTAGPRRLALGSSWSALTRTSASPSATATRIHGKSPRETAMLTPTPPMIRPRTNCRVVGIGRYVIGMAKPRMKPARRAELLIDCEEDRTLRAVLVGMLRQADPGWVSE